MNTRQTELIDLMDMCIKSFKTAGEIIMATAFVDDFAVETIQKWLKQKNVRKVRILTGVFGRLNRRRVFKQFESLQRTRKKLEVHISNDPKFHWKFYGFICSSRPTYFVGSSNFTEEGFCRSGNAMVEIRMYDSFQHTNLYNLFENEWSTGQSRPLDRAFLKSYTEAAISEEEDRVDSRPPKRPASKGVSSRPKPEPGGFFIACASKPLTKRQVEAVMEATRWEHDSFDAIGGKDVEQIRPGDKVVLFELQLDKSSKDYEPEALTPHLVEDRYGYMGILDDDVPVLWHKDDLKAANLSKEQVRSAIQILQEVDWDDHPCLRIDRETWERIMTLYPKPKEQGRVALVRASSQ